MNSKRAPVAPTKRLIPTLRLDLSIPEHAEVWSAYQAVASSARPEWVRLTLSAGIAHRGGMPRMLPVAASEVVAAAAPAAGSKAVSNTARDSTRKAHALSGAFSTGAAR